MKDKASSVKVELPHTNCTRGGHILHEQEYNTGHGVSAIPDEVRGETRRQASQPEVQRTFTSGRRAGMAHRSHCLAGPGGPTDT